MFCPAGPPPPPQDLGVIEKFCFSDISEFLVWFILTSEELPLFLWGSGAQCKETVGAELTSAVGGNVS